MLKDSKLLTGKEMKELLPVRLLPKIKQAMKDVGLDFDKDLDDCQVIYSPHFQSCFLKHGYAGEFEKGIMICSFKKDGSGFNWGRPHLHYFKE